MIILVAILNLRQMSWFYVTSPSLPSTRGRQTVLYKFIKNSGFDQKQKCLRHFAENCKKIYLSKKEILGL